MFHAKETAQETAELTCSMVQVRAALMEKEMATTPIFLPGKSHGQRSLEGYSLWAHKSRT